MRCKSHRTNMCVCVSRCNMAPSLPGWPSATVTAVPAAYCTEALSRPMAIHRQTEKRHVVPTVKSEENNAAGRGRHIPSPSPLPPSASHPPLTLSAGETVNSPLGLSTSPENGAPRSISFTSPGGTEGENKNDDCGVSTREYR